MNYDTKLVQYKKMPKYCLLSGILLNWWPIINTVINKLRTQSNYTFNYIPINNKTSIPLVVMKKSYVPGIIAVHGHETYSTILYLYI